MGLKCLHYNYNDTEITCTHSYEKCAKVVNCPENGDEHHCFVVWKLEGNKSIPISTGCNRNYNSAPDEKCGDECLGSHRGPRYYCCCSQDLCNSNFTLPINNDIHHSTTDQQQSSSSTNIISNSQLNETTKQSFIATESILLTLIPILLLILLICAYLYKFRRRLFKTATSRFMGVNNGNRINDRHLTINELNEYRNNNTLSILTPFREVFGGGNKATTVDGDNPGLANNNHHHHHHHHQHTNNSNYYLNHQNNHQHHLHPQQQLQNPHHHQQHFNNLKQKSTNHHDANNHSTIRIDLNNDIKLLEVIGSGRFGTVHRAKMKRIVTNQAAVNDINKTNNTNNTYDSSSGHKDNKSTSTNNNNNNTDVINITDHTSNTTKNNNDSKDSINNHSDNNTNKGKDEKVGDYGEENYSEIAVKIIMSSDHQSWLNERQVYDLPKLKHKNILNFILSDEHLQSATYWLVVEYASKGSLYNYIKENTITWNEFLYISLGIVHGLAHLHEVEIAHRDFKSKNVLLRHDLSPCITDFGVAAILDTTQGSQLDHRKKYLQVGTPRYMAPEVLECSVTFTKSSFTKIDVYALSLVLWELLSRCYPMPFSLADQQSSTPTIQPPQANQQQPTTNSETTADQQQQPEPYKMPFEDEAGPHPDINEMRQIVVVRKRRPILKSNWRAYPVSEFCRAIEDGWEYDCDARISASCFVERVDSVSEDSTLPVANAQEVAISSLSCERKEDVE